jgi:hypothetical protein
MSQNLLSLGLAMLAGSYLINNSIKKREGFRADDIPTGGRNSSNTVYDGQQGIMSNPGNFPSTPSVRSDVNGTIQSGLRATAPGQISAVGASFTNGSGSPIDYKSIGSYTQNTLLRNNLLTSSQVTQALKDVYGGKTPELQTAQDLLPIPDMKYASTVDPTNPQNFIYDRTLFARLKRRYGNGVDFIRGDIDIKPEYRGWFDIRPPADNDLVQGYFDKYIDIEQETQLQDAIFTRNTPISDALEGQVNPWGKQYLLPGVANQTSQRFA